MLQCCCCCHHPGNHHNHRNCSRTFLTWEAQANGGHSGPNRQQGAIPETTTILSDRYMAASGQKLRPWREQLTANTNSGFFLPRRPNNILAPPLPMFYRACSCTERVFPRQNEETVVGSVRSIFTPCRFDGWLRHIVWVLDMARRNPPQHGSQDADRWAVPLGLVRSMLMYRERVVGRGRRLSGLMH